MFHRLFTQVRNNAVAYIALFVALGGTGLAASSAVPRNSVGTDQLKNRAVTGAKVGLHTLTGANVAKSTLTGFNIKSSTLGLVPNAARVGGLSAASLQRRVTGKCSGGQAIAAVLAAGKVTCQSVITGVTAGTGLTGGGTSGDVSLAVDPTVVQARVTSTCAAGRAMSSIKQDGTIGCHTTDVTQMMGGTGTATLSPTSDFLVPLGLGAPSAAIAGAELGAADAPSTARNLVVKVATAPASGASWTFEFYVDGKAQTSLQCVITGPASACHENGTVSIPKGARVALHEKGAGTPAATTATYGWTDTTF